MNRTRPPRADHIIAARVAGYTIPDEPLRGTLAVATWCKAANVPAEIVGRWVWIHFQAAPPPATRAALCAIGFTWIKRRAAWAHDCGHPSKRGNGDPRDRYGSIPVSDIAA